MSQLKNGPSFRNTLQPTITLFNNLRPSKGNINPISISSQSGNLIKKDNNSNNVSRLRNSRIPSLSTNFESNNKNNYDSRNSRHQLSEGTVLQNSFPNEDIISNIKLNDSIKSQMKSILKNSKFKPKKSLTQRISFSKKEIENFQYSTETFKRKNKNVVFPQMNVLTEKEVNEISEATELYEEFIILNEKLVQIINNIKNSRYPEYYCLEWWNYFNFSNLKERYDELYKDSNSKFCLYKDAMILESLSIILIYDAYLYSFPKSFFNSFIDLITLVYYNFLISLESYTQFFSLTNPQFTRINSILTEKITYYLDTFDRHTLRNNNSNIFKIIRDILEIYPNKDLADVYIDFLSNLNKLSLTEVDNFFKSKICISDNIINTPMSSGTYKAFKQSKVQIPFIKTKQSKDYVLVLDLEDTLINVKINKENGQATLNLRPGIFSFLDEVSMEFELIIFATGPAEISEPIINALESKKKYFSHRLFQSHNSIENNEYFKDLSLIGRNLEKTIIIDNIPKNFKLHRDNGIYIRTFSPEVDHNDTGLIDLLSILKKIIIVKPDDVRKELQKLKKQIAKCVSISFLSKN